MLKSGEGGDTRHKTQDTAPWPDQNVRSPGLVMTLPRPGSSLTVKLMFDKWLHRWHQLTQFLPPNIGVHLQCCIPAPLSRVSRDMSSDVFPVTMCSFRIVTGTDNNSPLPCPPPAGLISHHVVSHGRPATGKQAHIVSQAVRQGPQPRQNNNLPQTLRYQQ